MELWFPRGPKVPCSLRKASKGSIDSTNQWLHQYALTGLEGTRTDELPFVCKVCFISHQHDNDVTSPLCSHVVDPFRGLLEGVNIWKRNELRGRKMDIEQPGERLQTPGGGVCRVVRILNGFELNKEQQWPERWTTNHTSTKSTHLWCRKLQLQQQSLWCNSGWGYESAPAPPCPTTAT